ncbi:helix-turn-helix domain-containing protein [Anaerococcus tetradius]|uniref:helix-turn-helix domain-containing protein n=1 Tax=Anaerococcus tetradius TaxID=33036 RepID=UPI0023F18D8A|nr:helix-turn-helix transcriptional regulator [Anaerococcus tetradius]
MTDFKISLKAARVNKNMTQRELGEEIGRDATTILNWENGKSRIPLEDFKKICHVLKVPEDFVYLPAKSS